MILNESSPYRYVPTWFFTDEIVYTSGMTKPELYIGSAYGMVGHIYGYYIYASEENDFILFWSVGDDYKTVRISMPGPGMVMYMNSTPINYDFPLTYGGITTVYTPSEGAVYRLGILASGCVFVEPL